MSNVVQGLTLSGMVTGSGYGIIKSGTGTLALTNAGNDFGGASNSVEIRRGVVSVPNDGALGDATNKVILNFNATTNAGFRSTGTFSTARTFRLNQVQNAFEVTAGNVLTLTTAFDLPSTTNAIYKNDNGVLEIDVNNSTSSWSNAAGGIFINAGAVRLSDSNAAGLATNQINVTAAIGAALQLADNVTINNPLNLNTSGANETSRGGLNSGGSLQSVSGTNIYNGLITAGSDSGVGADSGAVLNITGGFNANGKAIVFYSAGTINLNSAFVTTAPFSVTKYGAGTLNITTAQGITLATSGGLILNAGTVSINTAGSLFAATTGALNVNSGATLVVDDSLTTPVANRLGNSAVNLNGRQFRLHRQLGGFLGIEHRNADAQHRHLDHYVESNRWRQRGHQLRSVHSGWRYLVRPRRGQHRHGGQQDHLHLGAGHASGDLGYPRPRHHGRRLRLRELQPHGPLGE